MLKGVALLLEKEKRSNFKSVIISRLEHCKEYINIILTKQNVIKNKIITLKTNFILYETNQFKKKNENAIHRYSFGFIYTFLAHLS